MSSAEATAPGGVPAGRSGRPELAVVLLDEPRAWRDGVPIELGRGVRSAAFAALALRANQIVTRAELVTALWDAPPRRPSNRVYAHISALRRAVQSDDAAGTELLESGSSGYRLVLDPDGLDVAVVQRRRDEARVHRAQGDAPAELSAIDGALALWRGTALAGVPGPQAEHWRRRLDETRLGLRTRRAQLMLEAGRASEVVDDLRELSAEHPAREDIHHALMLALCRSGRHDDAVEVYDEARRVLVDDFGTEPGAPLRALRRSLLDGAVGPSGPSGPGPGRPVDAGWPGAPGPVGALHRIASERPRMFVGRSAEIDSIGDAVARVRAGRGGALWFDGVPGVGKTALIAEGLARGQVDAGDCVVGWGAADTVAAGVPFGALQSCLAGVDPGLLQRVGLMAPDAVTGGAADRGQARLRLGAVNATVRALVEAAGGRPVVLVLDDLHHADDETLLVWRHLLALTATHPLLLVCGCRRLPRRRNLDLLRGLAAESGCTTVEVGGLPEEDMVELLRRAHSGAQPPAGLVAELSGGCPRFADAISRAARRVATVSASMSAPEVGTVVREHLDPLSPCTREMLRWAARQSDPHTVGDVVRASGEPAHTLLDSFDEALAAGVLVDMDGTRLRFRHPVVRYVLTESVPS